MKTVDELMEEAFGPQNPRDPRSEEYKAGVRTRLAFLIEGRSITCPYLTGTAQADAFFAGFDEANRICERQRGRFSAVHCSQCGRGFGPGDAGFSHCAANKHLKAID